jgi:hypothetical protein
MIGRPGGALWVVQGDTEVSRVAKRHHGVSDASASSA